MRKKNSTRPACTKETNNSCSDNSKDNAKNLKQDQFQCKNKNKSN